VRSLNCESSCASFPF